MNQLVCIEEKKGLHLFSLLKKKALFFSFTKEGLNGRVCL